MKEQALQYLEKCYEEHARSVPFIKLDPRLQNLRGDPRFGQILKKAGLTL
jgi:hypothetical protein